MRKLILNNVELDIDKDTVIGFDIQAYDVKEPAKPKVTVSNNISLPATSKNMNAIGYANDPQVDTDTPFDLMLVTYIVDNEIIVEDAKVRLTEVYDRIKLIIYDKNDIWDTFKLLKFPDIEAKLFAYLVVKYNYPYADAPVNSYAQFLDQFINNDSGIILPFYFSNFYEYKAEGDTEYYEGLNYITLANGSQQGGHFAIYAKDFFQFLEDEYGIDFQTNETFEGNIFKDDYASKVYFPYQSLTAINDNGSYYLSLNETETYPPNDDVTIKSDKSIYDFIVAYFQHFNVLIDYVWTDGNYVYKCYRFDDITTYAPLIDWSGKLSGTYKYYPILEGYNQTNYIKFGSIYEGSDSLFNSKKLTCANKNIDAEGDLFQIDAYCPNGVIATGGNFIPKLSVTDAFTTFTFLISTENTESVKVYLNTENITVTLKVPSLYALDNEYNTLNAIINKPRKYEVQKWMTIHEYKNLRFFAQYYIKELCGCYFLNKIKGFVAGSNRSTTTIELIKISNATPLDIPDADNFTDGLGNDFTDGLSNLLY